MAATAVPAAINAMPSHPLSLYIPFMHRPSTAAKPTRLPNSKRCSFHASFQARTVAGHLIPSGSQEACKPLLYTLSNRQRRFCSCEHDVDPPFAVEPAPTLPDPRNYVNHNLGISNRTLTFFNSARANLNKPQRSHSPSRRSRWLPTPHYGIPAACCPGEGGSGLKATARAGPRPDRRWRLPGRARKQRHRR